MKSVIFIFLLVAVLISTGCVSDNQNNNRALAAQTNAVTIQQTIQMIPSPTATEKITEPIVGIWKGTPENEISSAYCHFFENGDFMWSTSMGRDKRIQPGSPQYESRVIEENKLFGFNFNPTPDGISRTGNWGYKYAPNVNVSMENFQNLSWVKSGEDANKVYYITKMSDGSRATDIVYIRADNSVLINSTGLKLGRGTNFPSG
jgi:hypothetical protein